MEQNCIYKDRKQNISFKLSQLTFRNGLRYKIGTQNADSNYSGVSVFREVKKKNKQHEDEMTNVYCYK